MDFFLATFPQTMKFYKFLQFNKYSVQDLPSISTNSTTIRLSPDLNLTFRYSKVASGTSALGTVSP